MASCFPHSGSVSCTSASGLELFGPHGLAVARGGGQLCQGSGFSTAESVGARLNSQDGTLQLMSTTLVANSGHLQLQFWQVEKTGSCRTHIFWSMELFRHKRCCGNMSQYGFAVPYYLARINRSRARSIAKLSGNKTIEKQWVPEEEHGNVTRTLPQSGANRMRRTEIPSEPHGRTEEYCRYLDYLTTIDISYIAPWHQ